MFEQILGPGLIHTFLGRWTGRPGGTLEDQEFFIGWRLREDGQTNEILHCLYPFHPFSMDIAVVQIGIHGQVVPLNTIVTHVQACIVVQKYVEWHRA